jgi:hypothetical protein
VLVQIIRGFSSFLAGGPSSLGRIGGAISGTGCLVSQPFTAGENRSYSIFWVVTSDPRHPGYKTPTVVPESSIERVVRGVHSTGGRIGTHLLPQVPPWDSVVRSWG